MKKTLLNISNMSTVNYKEICDTCLGCINDDVLYEPDKNCIGILLTYKNEMNELSNYFHQIYNNGKKSNIPCSCGNPYGIGMDCQPKCGGCGIKRARLLKYMHIICLCMNYQKQVESNLLIIALLKLTDEETYRKKLLLDFNSALERHLPESQYMYIVKKMFKTH